MSGGIDSATCLFIGARRKWETFALTVRYGGIARAELVAAKRIAKAAGVAEHRILRVPDLKEAGDIRRAAFPGLPGTYIPLRNSVFYSLAGSYAEEIRARLIVGGHNKDDKKVFRDTGEDFFESMQEVLWRGSKILADMRTEIVRPLSGRSKPEVILYAKSLGVPFELTWSCHDDGSHHCWKCDGCRARASAFKAAGVRDPLEG